MKHLPVKATLITSDGFSKNIELLELKEVISIASKTAETKVVYEALESILNLSKPTTSIHFYLKKHKIVQQHKGALKYIVAVYKEM